MSGYVRSLHVILDEDFPYHSNELLVVKNDILSVPGVKDLKDGIKARGSEFIKRNIVVLAIRGHVEGAMDEAGFDQATKDVVLRAIDEMGQAYSRLAAED